MREVDVFIASLPRHLHIVETCKSLLATERVLSITITCNNYSDAEWQEVQQRLLVINTVHQVPIFLHRGDNAKKSNEKLKHINKGSGKYILIFDDDLTCSPDYLTYLIAGCEKYNAAVGLHGVVLAPLPIGSYYRDRQVFRGLGEVICNYRVDIVSDCGHLFKREWHQDLGEWYDRCNDVSMDDIFVNHFHRQKGIKRVCLQHDTHFLKHKVQEADETYVFDEYKFNDKIQTDYINKNFN